MLQEMEVGFIEPAIQADTLDLLNGEYITFMN